MEPDRVQPPASEQPPARPRRRFEEALRARTPRPVRRAPVLRRPAASAGSTGAPDARRMACSVAAARGQARVEMDAAARRRVDDGATATEQASARLEGRSTELLRDALRTDALARSELPPTSSPTEHTTPEAASAGPLARPGVEPPAAAGGASTTAPASSAEERIDRAMALVERIERFVRSGRPALALTLRGGLPGRLELQRVAPGVVSLRLSSTRPPGASELGELRQALEARGLSVRSLESRLLTASAAAACSPCP